MLSCKYVWMFLSCELVMMSPPGESLPLACAVGLSATSWLSRRSLYGCDLERPGYPGARPVLLRLPSGLAP